MSSDDLSIQGTLAETTVPDLFRSLIRSSETAVVSLEAGPRHDTIYVTEGKIMFASSTDPDMGLAEVLLAAGELTLDQYHSAMERVTTPRRMGALLCDLGYLKPEELMRSIEKQASAIVLNAVRYRSGNFTIEFTSTFADDILALPLNTDRLILDGVTGIEFWSLVSRGIGRVDRVLQQVRSTDARAYQLELTEEENHVLNFFDEPTRIGDVCSRSYLSNFATCRMIWGLMSINLLQDAETDVVTEKRAAVESEYELEGLVERYNGAYQAIFGLVFQKIGDHVYDFMDRVVLHLSPETMPYLSGMNFINEGRVDFDQLFNNMIASGSSDHTSIVHNVLNELLYGWILEVKSEFGGTSLERDIVALVNTLKR
jgi:hypothetical protein